MGLPGEPRRGCYEQMCVEYLLRLPVPIAVDCLGGLFFRIGAVKAARFLGHSQTDGERKPVRCDF